MFSRAHPFYTVFLPIILFVMIVFADRPFPDFLPGLTGSEFGLVEMSQALLLLVAFIWGMCILLSGRYELSAFLKTWLVVTLIAVFYTKLEEVSYGQHYLAWATPDIWLQYNDQGETNLHNTSSWLDQKPRLILELGVLIGGIIVPLLRRYKPSALPEKFKEILPDSRLLTVALLAMIPKLYDTVLELTPYYDALHLFNRQSEVQEFYFYYFMMLYYVFLPSGLQKRAKAS